LGRAFKISLLQMLIPLPLMLLLGVFFFMVARDVLAPGAPSALAGLGYAVGGAIIVGWVVSVMLTGFVYGVQFLTAAVFNTLTWIVHGAIYFMLGLGGTLMRYATEGAAVG
jgi:hypothetical protein